MSGLSILYMGRGAKMGSPRLNRGYQNVTEGLKRSQILGGPRNIRGPKGVKALGTVDSGVIYCLSK